MREKRTLTSIQVVVVRSDNLGFMTVDTTKDYKLVRASGTFVSVSTDNNLLYVGGTPDQYPAKGLLNEGETVSTTVVAVVPYGA